MLPSIVDVRFGTSQILPLGTKPPLAGETGVPFCRIICLLKKRLPELLVSLDRMNAA